jgi:hypothetical protein
LKVNRPGYPVRFESNILSIPLLLTKIPFISWLELKSSVTLFKVNVEFAVIFISPFMMRVSFAMQVSFSITQSPSVGGGKSPLPSPSQFKGIISKSKNKKQKRIIKTKGFLTQSLEPII